MKRFLSLLLVSLLFSGEARADFTQATVNRSTVPFGQSFMLTVETDVSNPQKPDFGVLEKDFNIYSQGYVSNVSFINGQQTSTSGWQLILMPKQKGSFTIPAFDINGASSQPITINVTESGGTTDDGNAAPTYRMSARISNNAPYVQQEVIYKVSLFDGGGLQGSEPTFTTSRDWVIRSLGEPEVRPMVVNGKKSREIVFSYALFPQRSGKLEIPQAHFEGFYLTKNKRSIDPFERLFGDDIRSALLGDTDFFAARNPVRLSTEPVSVEVKPIPAQNNGHWWLPAKDVVLAQQWEPQNPKFKVGEAVNRTVYIKADGVLDNQLPDMKFAAIKGLKQYPEKPESEMKAENGSVVSIAKISNVYIPTAAGKITIPAAEVDWFNVNSGKYEKASLPAMEIEVEPSAPGQIMPSETPAAAPDANEIKSDTPEERSKNIKNIVQDTKALIGGEAATTGFTNTEIVILLLGAFSFGILISYMLMKPRGSKEHEDIRDYRRQLVKAAQAKDIRTLRDAILGWCRQKYGAAKVSSFNDVNKLVKDKSFAEELDKLTAALYADNGSEWDTDAFLKSFEKIDKKKINQKSEAKLLPDLYK